MAIRIAIRIAIQTQVNFQPKMPIRTGIRMHLPALRRRERQMWVAVAAMDSLLSTCPVAMAAAVDLPLLFREHERMELTINNSF